jgi:hypothetical protein
MDYIPQVSEHITDHVKSYQLRKNYILEFVKQLGGVLLEYDAVDWRKASVLLDYEQTCIVVHCTHPPSFPNPNLSCLGRYLTSNVCRVCPCV